MHRKIKYIDKITGCASTATVHFSGGLRSTWLLGLLYIYIVSYIVLTIYISKQSQS